jgi:hypothetical protein
MKFQGPVRLFLIAVSGSLLTFHSCKKEKVVEEYEYLHCVRYKNINQLELKTYHTNSKKTGVYSGGQFVFDYDMMVYKAHFQGHTSDWDYTGTGTGSNFKK